MEPWPPKFTSRQMMVEPFHSSAWMISGKEKNKKGFGGKQRSEDNKRRKMTRGDERQQRQKALRTLLLTPMEQLLLKGKMELKGT